MINLTTLQLHNCSGLSKSESALDSSDYNDTLQAMQYMKDDQQVD